MPSILSLLLFFFLIAIMGMSLWAFYVWWKKDRHTRERFAFAGFFALSGFGVYYLARLGANASIIGGLIKIGLKPFGVDIPSKPLSNLETLIFAGVFASLVYAYLQVFKHWKGRWSRAQYEQKQNGEAASVLKDILLVMRRDKTLLAHHEGDDQARGTLKAPKSLPWHERARQLWLLKNRWYLFNDEDGYDPARKCWMGKEKKTGALAFLACYGDAPSDREIRELAQYARKVADAKNQKEVELIIATKNDGARRGKPSHGDAIRYISESELLEDLVDFSDYFDDIRNRVERDKLMDSDLTLRDMYTPSSFRFEEDKEPPKNNLEEFVFDWLRKNTRRQLSVLGEYGQGKSAASLLISHHLIQRFKIDSDTRIPILIELRGKTLRTLPPEELLATWAYRYRMDAQALWHLHMAGRLLLIFEGFDEIDLSGDTESRIGHFKSLWRFNFENSKIIITGRPNFFLDSKELKRALGNDEQTRILNIEPFSVEQIENSLRGADAQIRAGILDLARRDSKFREVVARPLALYIVSVLWESELLSKRERINSAMVIDLFVQHTLRRQQDKHDERPFMVLNSAERRYFMTGVAACMAVKGWPNQIDNQQLMEAVKLLVEAIPDAVSQRVTSVGNEESRPLRSEERFEWKNKRNEVMDRINADVRSCGLLVTDLSKDGTFKFAHKSYMEFLQAQAISPQFVEDKTEIVAGRSISKAVKLKIYDLQNSDEAIAFLAELLEKVLNKKGVEEDDAVAQGLFDILVIGKLSGRHTLVSLLTRLWTSPSKALTNLWVGAFGFKNRKIARFIFPLLLLSPLLIFCLVLMFEWVDPLSYSFAFVAAGVFASAFAFAVAVAGAAGAFVLAVAVAGVFVFGGPFAGISAVAFAFLVAGAVAFADADADAFSGAGSFAGAFAGLVAGAGVLLSLFYIWDYDVFFHPVFMISPLTIGLLSGVIAGLSMDFLIVQESFIFKRLRLWRRACLDLRLQSESIEKTVGKGMAALLTDACDRRKNESDG